MERIDLTAAVREPIQGHTSKGDQPKWRRGNLWYKADHMGYEALAEVVVSRLLEKTNVPEFVRYDPALIRYEAGEAPGCVSRSFQGGQEMLVPFERLHAPTRGGGWRRSWQTCPGRKSVSATPWILWRAPQVCGK